MLRQIETRLGKMIRVGASATALIWAQGAYAQDSAAAAPQAAVDDSASTPEIIVTATKRNERLQDVPVSVVVLSPAVLAQSGTVSTTQLPSLAPGLAFGAAGQPKLASFYIRGVGTYALGPTLESSVGVAIDGVPLARIGGSIADMIDVDHIEVLKGPQGTLFGKNATAGLISIVNKKPVIGQTSFVGHLSYGSYNELNVDATANLSLGDSGAFRFTAWRAGHDGITHDRFGNKYDDANSYGARASVLVKPTETLTLSLTGQFDGRDQAGSALILRQYSAITAPPIIAYTTSIGITPSPRNRTADLSQKDSFIFGKNFAVTGQVDWDMGGGYTLTNVTSYRDVYDKSTYDTFATSNPLVKIPQLFQSTSYNQFTSELRVASPAEKQLSFVAGLFYYDFSIKDFTQFEFFGVPSPGVSDFTRQAYITDNMKNYAAFGDVTFRVTDGIRILGGVRQSHDRTGGSFRRVAVGTDVPPLTPLASVFSFTPNSVKYNFTSYRVGAQADLAKDVMLYATMSRGYKAPGFNLASSLTTSQLVNNTNVAAEKAKSIEGGIKSQFFNRRLTVNITAFHSVFSDFQTTVSQPSVPGSFIIQNANESKSDGVEFDFSARPAGGLTLGLKGAYINSRFTDYTGAPCYVNQPQCTTLVTSQSLNGARTPLAPKWSLNSNIRYDMEIGGDWKGYVGSDANYRSKTLFEGKNDPNEAQKAYTVVNFNAGFGPADGRWTVSAYLRNAFKQHFVLRVRDQLNIYQQINSYEALRRIGAQLEVKF